MKIKLKYKFVFVFIVLCFPAIAAPASKYIEVSNVRVIHKGNWFIINYNLSHSGYGKIFVELEFAANGRDFTKISSEKEKILGDIGIVEPGIDKEIKWNVAAGVPNHASSAAKVQIIADYKYIGVLGHSHGVILDRQYDLYWTQKSNILYKQNDIYDNGLRGYNEALSYIESMNNGLVENFGFTDWRIPTDNEINTLPFNENSMTHPFMHLKSKADYFTTTQQSGSRQLFFIRGQQK